MLKMKRQLSLPAPCWNRCSNYTKHCCSRSMRTWVRETRVSIKGRFGRGYQIGDRRATHFFPAESTACAMYPGPRFKWMCWRRICPEGTTFNKKSFNSFFLLIQCVYPEPDVLLLITICLILVLALCLILVLPVMGGWISERCDLSGKLLWLRMAARSQVHTNTSSRPAGRFLQRLSFQQTEFQCEPPPLQRREAHTGKHNPGWHRDTRAGISGEHYRMHQTSTLERSCWSNWHWKVLQWKRNRSWKHLTNTGKVFGLTRVSKGKG